MGLGHLCLFHVALGHIRSLVLPKSFCHYLNHSFSYPHYYLFLLLLLISDVCIIYDFVMNPKMKSKLQVTLELSLLILVIRFLSVLNCRSLQNMFCRCWSQIGSQVDVFAFN